MHHSISTGGRATGESLIRALFASLEIVQSEQQPNSCKKCQVN